MFGKRQRPTEKFLSIPDFTPLVNLQPDLLVESNEVTVTADNAWVFTALLRGGDAELNVNGAGWTKDAVFRNGDTIKLRATSSLVADEEVTINLYAQSTNKQWSITTSTGVYDSDAQNYINAVEAADGQVLETAVKDAINNFVVGCKADGIWDAIKASCILAGARTLSGALQPLVGTAPTNFNFVSGDYNRKTGLVGNGSTKYLNSNRNNNADPQNSKHLAIYITSPNSTNVLHIGCGAFNVTGSSHLLNLFGDGSYSARILTSDVPSSSISYNSSPTFFGASRGLPNAYEIRALGQTVSELSNSEAPLNESINVFRVRSSFSSVRLSFYSIGEALDLTALDTRVSNLMTAIGAAIP